MAMAHLFGMAKTDPVDYLYKLKSLPIDVLYSFIEIGPEASEEMLL